jgi:16S rRNA (cytidine1402-2'-O)-methyltransferase
LDEATATGTLYLVPVPLGPEDDPLRVLPPATVEATVALDCFVAEHARSARAVLARLPMRRPLQEITIVELNRNTPEERLPELLGPLLAGRDTGLLSEAGCPAVADPGAALVALAHRRGIRVVPLVGPSSLLLALMASGMNGQAFSFAGYVPVDPAERGERLRELERRSASTGETVLMIETPYRTQALFDAMLETLAPTTRVGVAARLTMPGETTQSRTVDQWRALRPALERTPTVLSLQAERAGPPPRSRAKVRKHPGSPPGGTRAPRPGRGR